jgi:hypothetical protein
MKTKIHILFVLFICIISYTSCEWEKLPAPPVPHASASTENLEAMFVETPINSLTDKYWKTADFVDVQLSDIKTQNLYPDGLLNMTGTFAGLTGFNKGDSIKLTLKAAFDDENIYILATWNDQRGDAFYKSWLYNGNADHLKQDSATGWTSQKNSDKLYLIFDNLNATQKDFWKWDMALSEPFGYAMDMYIDQNGIEIPDEGDPFYTRNNIGTNDRSGPQYNWDGVSQQLNQANGKTVLLDPTYYLINKKEYTGDYERGREKINHGCNACHGEDLSGDFEAAMNFPEMNRNSDEALISKISNPEHDGISVWEALSETDKLNVISAMRSISGIPGNILLTPTGSGTDVTTYSNVNVSNFSASQNKEYKLLLKRKLNTGNQDDIIIDTISQSFNFTIGLTDNDEINYVGKQLILTFKYQYND